jgi:hypothetical protein
MRQRNGMNIDLGGTGLLEAAKLIMEPVCERMGEPGSLRLALTELYTMLADEEIDVRIAADMMMELIRLNEDHEAGS